MNDEHLTPNLEIYTSYFYSFQCPTAPVAELVISTPSDGWAAGSNLGVMRDFLSHHARQWRATMYRVASGLRRATKERMENSASNGFDVVQYLTSDPRTVSKNTCRCVEDHSGRSIPYQACSTLPMSITNLICTRLLSAVPMSTLADCTVLRHSMIAYYGLRCVCCRPVYWTPVYPLRCMWAH